MKSIIAPLVAVALSTSGLGSAAFGQNADTVLLNGKIVTLDAAMPTAEALAVRDGKIVAVGTLGRRPRARRRGHPHDRPRRAAPSFPA